MPPERATPDRATLERLQAAGVIPVVRASTAAEARLGIEALAAAGIDVFEITMTVPGATRLIAELAASLGSSVLLGAGTVLDPATATACIDAGARFVVCPALRPEVLRCCRERGVLCVPGALTPTEILGAVDAGASMVKVFPVAAVGGPSYVKHLRGPLPHLPLLPTGGVTVENAVDYLQAGAQAVGLGSDLVDLQAIRSGHAAMVTERARSLLARIQAARRRADSATRESPFRES